MGIAATIPTSRWIIKSRNFDSPNLKIMKAQNLLIVMNSIIL